MLFTPITIYHGFSVTTSDFSMLVVDNVWRVLYLILIVVTVVCNSDKSGKKEEEKWKKKDVRDYDDGDVERLYDQWEVCTNNSH